MDLLLADKVVIVMGGSRGIGRGCSIEFAQEKASVAVVARSQGPIDECVELCRKAGATKAVGISADCGTREGVKKAVDECTKALGAPDILIFNMDDGTKGNFFQIDDETFDEVNQINVKAFIWAVRAVIPHMQEKQFGRIITIATEALRTPHTWLPRTAQNTYRIAAAALSKTLSFELQPWGITVNTMGTGGFATEQSTALRNNPAAPGGAAAAPAAATPPPRRGSSDGGVQVPRIGQPKDMGAPVAFLASPRAWYISGQIINVDGGSNKALM